MTDLAFAELAASILGAAINLSLLALSAAFIVTVARVILGPTLPDRVLALDALVSIAIGFIAVIGIKTGFALYVDIAIALGLVGFLATVALARFIMMRGKTEEELREEKRRRARERAEREAAEEGDALDALGHAGPSGAGTHRGGGR